MVCFLVFFAFFMKLIIPVSVIAAQSIANIVKSSLGPLGLDKMLVDNIGVLSRPSVIRLNWLIFTDDVGSHYIE
jgi:hypothetical protein